MASALTDTTTAAGGDVVVSRRRGKSKAPNFKYAGPVSVIRLELDVSDERVRRRVERHWGAVFRLRRALQRDVQQRCRAYWAAHHQRAADSKAVRDRLGLARNGIEAAAKGHIEASGWMRDHLTKAIGLHMAGEVWETIDRAPVCRRLGAPAWAATDRVVVGLHPRPRACPLPHQDDTHVGNLPARGTLDGHLSVYRHPGLPVGITTAGEAAWQPSGSSILAQPARLPAPTKPAGSWWDHTGPLAVVFTGLPAGDLVLPVRLPQGRASRLTCAISWPTRPSGTRSIWCGWPTAAPPGGWRYYAHLLTHQDGYQSESTRARRAEVPDGRRVHQSGWCPAGPC